MSILSATRLDEDFKEVATKDTPRPKDRANGAAPAIEPYLVYYLAEPYSHGNSGDNVYK